MDYFLHVNPRLRQRALAMIYNPLGQPATRTLSLPFYYTGLTSEAWVREQEGPATRHSLDRDYHIQTQVTVPAHGRTWLVIEDRPPEPVRHP